MQLHIIQQEPMPITATNVFDMPSPTDPTFANVASAADRAMLAVLTEDLVEHDEDEVLRVMEWLA